MSPPTSTDVASALLAQRRAFRAFLVARVGNEPDADDLLQQGLVKAIRRAGELKDLEKSVAWFYQILRHLLIDHGRQRQATRRREDAWASEAAVLAIEDGEAPRQICRCFEGLLPALKPRHAALLRLVALEGQSVSAAARVLGLTANNASVTLHRARAELRTQLVGFCGSCAASACLDCDCAETVPATGAGAVAGTPAAPQTRARVRR